MKVAIVNLITRTPVAGRIPRIRSNRQTLIYHLARSLATCGVEVTLFVSDLYRPEDEAEEAAEPFRITYVRTVRRGSPVLPITPGLLGALRNRFDVVISSEVTQPATFFCLLSKLLSRRQALLVWQEMALHQAAGRTIPSRIFHATYVRHLLSRVVNRFVPRSIASRAFVGRYCGLKRTTEPVLHGVNEAIFTLKAAPEADFAWRFIYPARLEAVKNVDQAIDVIAQLRREGRPATLEIVGNGPLEDDLRAKIACEGLERAVTLTTTHLSARQMHERYATASAMLVTTCRDLALVSIVEAVASGCPVVSSGHTDIAEEIEALGLGFVVRDGSTAAYAEALSRLGTEPGTREALYRAAMAVHDRFTNAAGAFLRLFREIDQC